MRLNHHDDLKQHGPGKVGSSTSKHTNQLDINIH